MKALILAGGSGVRFRPFTYWLPKQLMPVANRPVLEYAIGNVRDLGVAEVGVVVGEWEDAIRDALGDGARHGLRITYLRQERPLGLAHAVRLARPFLGGDDFVMYLGDNLLPDGVAAAAEEFRGRRPAAQLLLRRVPAPSEFGVAEVDPGGVVRGLVEKPARPRSDLAVIGVYFFTAAIHKATEAIEPSARGELEITDAIQWLIDRGAGVLAHEYHGFWQDVGRVEDLLAGNRRLLTGLRPAVAGRVDAASRLRGRVVVGRGARVVRSHIEGPVIIGPGTLVEDSRIGAATSVGRDCVVRAAELSDSVVLDGARVEAVRGLRESVIGQHATVRPVHDDQPGRRRFAGDRARTGSPFASQRSGGNHD
ncbi:glucose-1-phosphate thymidylyltransferase [Rhizomonospora bruguierae]|uniref:glucose-1-phosphate thymidylyltransferase n=1 Tax=Rhizomonospora bruguierae TaxID=1581705 RepID=UPI001BCF9A8E|nr:glucose-1-phosphate thymidylyltransferase [Micromonospora sp. NBRC 107566]